jgi:proliferating cell nuclear antigen
MPVLTYTDAKEFAYVVDSVSVLVDEASFVVRGDGLYLRALDPSRTAMVDLYIPKRTFEEFPEVDELRFGLNLKDFKKLLRGVKKGDKISMEIGGEKVRVRLVGKSTRSIGLYTIETAEGDLPTPNISYTAVIKINSDILAMAVKDAATVADEVRLSADKDAFAISAYSDRGEVEVRVERGSEFLYEFDVKEPASARFSLEYLEDIMGKASKISDIVAVELATDKPLRLTFDMPSGGRIVYYLAPRV